MWKVIPFCFVLIACSQPVSRLTRSQTSITVDSLSVPMWTNLPVVDGQLKDSVYHYATAVSIPVEGVRQEFAEARLYHSGQDLYLSVSGLSNRQIEKMVLLLSPEVREAGGIRAGDFRLEIGRDSITGIAIGKQPEGWVRQRSIPDDITAAMTASSGFWQLELRLPLDWTAGYARSGKLALLLEDLNGNNLGQWPALARPDEPATWSTVHLDPRYHGPVLAGSAFTDGFTGYLAFPPTEAWDFREMTFETWVQIPATRKGVLLSKGSYPALWLGADAQLHWADRQNRRIVTMEGAIDSLWHHLSVTKDRQGEILFFLDGRERSTFKSDYFPLDNVVADHSAPGWSMGYGPGDDGSGQFLPTYLRDLRIWNYPRNPEQLRRAAFQLPAEDEPGLVHWWLFDRDLNDKVGSCHAGLVGNAALARRIPDGQSFPPVVPAEILRLQDPVTEPPAWNGILPLLTRNPQINGIARPEEYQFTPFLPIAAAIPQFQLLAGPDGLTFTTNLLPGRARSGDKVVLYLNPGGQGGRTPSANDLRIELRPDSSLEVAKWNGRGFVPQRINDFVYRTTGGDTLGFQDGEQQFALPWWEGELQIGQSALIRLSDGAQLRLAVEYQTSIPANRALGVARDTLIRGSWPEHFNAAVPATWELVTLSADTNRLGSSSGRERAFLSCPSPGPSPTTADFNQSCPYESWKELIYIVKKWAKWPLVDAPCNAFVRAEGTLKSIGIAEEDAVILHDSHDFDMHITVPAKDRWLVINGGNDLVLETESGKFDRRALPNLGDHVTAYGRWIFDCGHSPKTEIHPLPVFETDRQEYRPVWPDGTAQKVAVIRIWITKNPGTYVYGKLLEKSYTFSVSLPVDYFYYPYKSYDYLPFIRQIKGSTETFERANFDLSDPGSLKLTLHQPAEGYYEFLAGYFNGNTSSLPLSTHTVIFPRIHINDDHDKVGPGDWFMLVNVNGNWRTIFWNGQVNTDGGSCDYGGIENSGYCKSDVPPIITSDPELQIQVIGYEDDDGNGHPGGIGDKITETRSSYWNRGSIDLIAQKKWELLEPGSDWALDYKATKGGTVPGIFGAKDFWEPRIKDEHPTAVELGSLSVPAAPGTTDKTTYSAFLLQDTNIRFDATKILKRDDKDDFYFYLDDFADVGIATSGNAQYQILSTGDWQYNLPDNIKQMLGYKSAKVRVRPKYNDVTVDLPYSLVVERSYRVFPPDWGEGQDAQGGRLVDLRTPDPKAEPVGITNAPSRKLTMDWAWQHVAGDVDIYKIQIPEPKKFGPDIMIIPCPFSHLEYLTISAPGMEIIVPAAGEAGKGKDVLKIKNLASHFPEGNITAFVKHPDPKKRGVYRLQAHWWDSQLYSPEECEAMGKPLLINHTITKTIPVPVYNLSKPVPDPVNVTYELAVSPLGSGVVVIPGASGSVDLAIEAYNSLPIHSLFYDADGVLIGEGNFVGNGPGPRNRLRVQGLRPGGQYQVRVMQLGSVEKTAGGLQHFSIGQFR